jgi:hypothetical protein
VEEPPEPELPPELGEVPLPPSLQPAPRAKHNASEPQKSEELVKRCFLDMPVFLA